MSAQVLADVIVVAHLAYVAFVVLLVPIVVLGAAQRWRWVRNRWLRGVHLAMIGIVVIESLIGVDCPLTTWEQRLRESGGEHGYQGGFIENVVHQVMFFDIDPAVFTIIYVAFGLLVAALLFIAPPIWRPKRT